MTVTINGTTGIAGVDGSAATPAVQGADTNTGIFFPAADTIAFTEGGTEVMRINSSGQAEFTAGTAALPAITATGDTNTGIFFSAADTIDFSEGGTATGQFDSSGNFKFNSGYGSVVTAYGCRAWVNFNGTGTVAIRGSGNVTSITDNGTGDYTVNFTTALVDVNYSVVGMSKIVTGASGENIRIHSNAYATAVTTTAVKIQTTNGGNVAVTDSEMINIAVFR